MIVISPILNRELLSFLRTRRAMVGLFLYLLILASAAYISYDSTTRGKQSIKRDDVSRTLFRTITMTQLLIFSAYALILTATKINSERDRNTLEILMSAPLSRWHILHAKFASALTVILLLTLASLPVLSLCFILGGLGWQEYVAAFYIILLAVLTYGMVGMACSAVCRRNYTALMAAFLIMILLHWIVMWLLILSGGDELAQAVSPVLCCVAIISGEADSKEYAILIATHTVYELLLFGVAYSVASSGLWLLAGGGQEPRGKERPETRRRRAGAAGERRKQTRERRSYRQIKDGANPVFVREDRHIFPRTAQSRAMRGVMAGVVMLLLAMVIGQFDTPDRYRFGDHMCTLGFVLVAAAALFAPAYASRALTSEREANSLPLLVVTVLRPVQVLVGKLLVLLKHAFRGAVLFSLIVVLVFALWARSDLLVLLFDWLKILPPVFAAMAFFASIGLLFSVVCRKTISAMACAYGAVLLLTIGPYLFGAFHQLSGQGNLPGDTYRIVTPLISPCTYFIPMEDVNYWFENDRWGNSIGYCALMLILSLLIFAAASRLFESRLRQDV